MTGHAKSNLNQHVKQNPLNKSSTTGNVANMDQKLSKSNSHNLSNISVLDEQESKIKDVDELLDYIEGNQKAVANDKKKAKKERQKQQRLEELRKKEEEETQMRAQEQAKSCNWGCGKIFLPNASKKEKHKHRSEECPRRPVQCQDCKQQGIPFEALAEHLLESCPAGIAVCEECHTEVARGKLESGQHMRDECPRRIGGTLATHKDCPAELQMINC